MQIQHYNLVLRELNIFSLANSEVCSIKYISVLWGVSMYKWKSVTNKCQVKTKNTEWVQTTWSLYNSSHGKFSTNVHLNSTNYLYSHRVMPHSAFLFFLWNIFILIIVVSSLWSTTQFSFLSLALESGVVTLKMCRCQPDGFLPGPVHCLASLLQLLWTCHSKCDLWSEQQNELLFFFSFLMTVYFHGCLRSHSTLIWYM